MAHCIIDLHSDLLSYLREAKNRGPYDPQSRSSLEQLKKGQVKLQTLAIFSHSKQGSTQIALEQLACLKKLTQTHFQECALFAPDCFEKSTTQVQFILAFENASGFSEESEPLVESLQRLDRILKEYQHILYISLTWDGENRFGGGVGSQVGLKEDGKRLLEWLSGKKIAVDFSHTSDRLAEEILNTIDQQRLEVPVLASHSNYRAITDLPRNMPDWLAQEIILRKGILGLNLFAPFIRKNDPSVLLRHIEYALSLGGENNLAFGADFFCDADFPSLFSKYQTQTAFFKEYPDASCYGAILEQIKDKLRLTSETVQKIASKNAERFLKSNLNILKGSI